MKQQRILVVGVILVAVVLAFAFWRSERKPTQPDIPSGQPTVVLKVAVGTWAGYGNVYVGIEKEYFGSLKVSAIVMDDSNSASSGISGGFFIG
jgi:hypothetical protein